MLGFKDSAHKRYTPCTPIIRAIRMSSVEATNLCIDRVKVVEYLLGIDGCKIDGFSSDDRVPGGIFNVLHLASYQEYNKKENERGVAVDTRMVRMLLEKAPRLFEELNATIVDNRVKFDHNYNLLNDAEYLQNQITERVKEYENTEKYKNIKDENKKKIAVKNAEFDNSYLLNRTKLILENSEENYTLLKENIDRSDDVRDPRFYILWSMFIKCGTTFFCNNNY
jgi:hypothetical protein